MTQRFFFFFFFFFLAFLLQPPERSGGSLCFRLRNRPRLRIVVISCGALTKLSPFSHRQDPHLYPGRTRLDKMPLFSSLWDPIKLYFEALIAPHLSLCNRFHRTDGAEGDLARSLATAGACPENGLHPAELLCDVGRPRSDEVRILSLSHFKGMILV